MIDLKGIKDPELRHIVAKTIDAKRADDYGVLSTGERLAAAVVLNRHDWLTEMNYTMVEAISRIGPEWMALLPQAERVIRADEDG